MNKRSIENCRKYTSTMNKMNFIFYLEKRFLKWRVEPVAFLDSWMPFKERTSGETSSDPFDWNHFAFSGKKSCVANIFDV